MSPQADERGSSHQLMLHIYNGDSTAGTAGKSALPGEHFAWREALVCGPVPGELSNEEFRDVRAKHLSEAYDVDLDQCKRELREQEEALAQYADHEEVVLWFDPDLFCQVHLFYLLNWFAQREVRQTKLSLICLDRFPGIPDFRGLGQLNEQQLTSLFPERIQVTPAQLQLGSKAWQAYSSSNPREIESLLNSDMSPLPFLKSALFKHLERFPSTRNGLGRIENSALALIADGHGEFKRMFSAFANNEALYGLGDAQLFLELQRLATAEHPLLMISNHASVSSTDSQNLLRISFQITDVGNAVLSGDADFIKLNGIDLWLGGVQLQGDEAAWRWDDVAQTLVCES